MLNIPKSQVVVSLSLLWFDLVRYHSPKKRLQCEEIWYFFLLAIAYTHDDDATIINAPLSSSEIIINARRQTSSPAHVDSENIFSQLHFERVGGKLKINSWQWFFLVNRIGKRHAVHLLIPRVSFSISFDEKIEN